MKKRGCVCVCRIESSWWWREEVRGSFEEEKFLSSSSNKPNELLLERKSVKYFSLGLCVNRTRLLKWLKDFYKTISKLLVYKRKLKRNK
jgi:hypothetical protein